LATAIPPTDPNQPQSPPRPTPSWVKLVDHGGDDPRLKGYVAPEGLKIEIIAENPVVVNPVGITFAPDGTLVVLEWCPSPGDEWRETPEEFTYKDGTKRKVATMKKKTKDVVKVLHFNKDKGIYDRAEVVLEEELPSSLLLHDGWLYIASRGTVRRYRWEEVLAKPKMAKPEVIAQGFCGFHHHQVSGVSVGPDGWLYITSGDDDNYVEGSDGSRATVLRTGAVFRCRPDGSKMHVFSIGYRNPYRDLVFDTAYNWFHVDNDNEDGSRFTGCRLMHVAEEADFGWRLFTGARCCRPDHVRGAVFGELPGKLPAMLKTGRGSPAGLLIYNDTRFPEHYRGLFYYPDVFRKLIRAYRVTAEGSTFQVAEEFEFLKSDDPLFRPCHMIAGPDGAMYVCDWRSDSGGAGKLWGDGVHGRIYRIRWAGNANDAAIPLRGLDSWAKVVQQSDAELVNSLSAADFSDRLQAQEELRRRGEKNRSALLALLSDKQKPVTARLAALGVIQSHWNDECKERVLGCLQDESDDVRRLAVTALGLNCAAGDGSVHETLVRLLSDGSIAVRRAVVLALGRIAAPGAEDSLLNAYRFDDGKDAYYTDAVLRGLERVGERGVRRLIDLAQSGSDKDRERAVSAFLTLRSRAAADALPTLLRNPHLTASHRASLLRSFANYLFDPPLSPEGLIGYLKSRQNAPADEKIAGLDALRMFPAISAETVSTMVLALLEDSDPAVRQAAIATVESTRMTAAIPILAARMGDKTWTGFERSAMLKALRSFGDKRTLEPLTAILKNEQGTTDEIRTLRLEALRSLAQMDPAAAQPFAEQLLSDGSEPMQAEAIQLLGSRPEGARLAAKRYLGKQLPRTLLPQVADALQKHVARHPDLEILRAEVMKGGLLISLDKSEVARVQELVRKRGNAQRGKALYVGSKALACVQCHKMEGFGGNVGPDLSRLWDTHSLEKILESMIEPSKEIKEGYQAYRLTTKKGQTYRGLKVVDTPAEVVLREATAKEIRVPRAEIEELEVSKQSLMPDNVIGQLTFDQFLDLVAFLKDRSAQESLRGMK
jgi:putative membrane-bound dehydrogenase-like protein